MPSRGRSTNRRGRILGPIALLAALLTAAPTRADDAAAAAAAAAHQTRRTAQIAALHAWLPRHLDAAEAPAAAMRLAALWHEADVQAWRAPPPPPVDANAADDGATEAVAGARKPRPPRPGRPDLSRSAALYARLHPDVTGVALPALPPPLQGAALPAAWTAHPAVVEATFRHGQCEAAMGHSAAAEALFGAVVTRGAASAWAPRAWLALGDVAFAALVAASAVAVLAGDVLARTIPPIWIERAAGALFVVLGVALLAGRGG